jgi:hypothetical protein
VVDHVPAGMSLARRRRWRALQGGPRTPSAPRTRRDGPKVADAFGAPKLCFPRPQGWFLGGRRGEVGDQLLCAPAGMVPRWIGAGRVSCPALGARGDGPTTTETVLHSFACSPRPQGWSRVRDRAPHRRRLLPAPAEMVPRSRP